MTKLTTLTAAFVLFGSFAQSQQTVGYQFCDSLSQEGYTLFAPLFSKSTYLIDNCGKKVNEWLSDYTPGASAYLTNDGLMARAGNTHNMIFNAPGTGGIIEFFNWDGDLVRTIEVSNDTFCQHHDFEVMPNGNVLVMGWEYRSTTEAIEQGRDSSTIDQLGLWPEAIYEYQLYPNDSEAVVWEWHVWDHLVQQINPTLANFDTISERYEKININFFGGALVVQDWLHLNSIDFNEELNQIMMSSLVFNEFWIIDHSTTTAEAATSSGGDYGKGGDLLYRYGNPQAYMRGGTGDQRLFGQHDAKWIPTDFVNGGKIMVFNNEGGGPELSSVDVIQPPTTSPGVYEEPISTLPFGPFFPEWKYEDPSFFAKNVSGAQPLPNGNILICEGPSGNFFEIDYNETVHWNYINPVNSAPVDQGTPNVGFMVFRSERYTPDFPGFADLVILPGEPVELNPIPYECDFYDVQDTINDTIIDTISGVAKNALASTLQIQNPFDFELVINNSSVALANYTLLNQLGQVIIETTSQGTVTVVPTAHLTSGTYLLRYEQKDSGVVEFMKVLKVSGL